MKFINDSDVIVWKEHYKTLYDAEEKNLWDFWRKIDYDNLPDEEFCGYVNIEFEEVSIDVSGDVDFNFSSDSNTRKWQKRKYEYYLNIIEKDGDASDEDKNRAKELLSYCEQRMFSPCNMSLVVRTGGMNNVKGKLSQDVHALDRFDVFVYVLDDYLSKPKENRNQMHIIFSYAWTNSTENRERLAKFLNKFDSTDDYFEKMYRIESNEESKKLIKHLTESGQKTINSTARVMEFLTLAKEFWRLKPINCSICELRDSCKLKKK